MSDAALVPFSDGPATWPGRELVLLLSSSMLAALLRAGPPTLIAPATLAAGRPLPGTLNHFGVRVRLNGG